MTVGHGYPEISAGMRNRQVVLRNPLQDVGGAGGIRSDSPYADYLS